MQKASFVIPAYNSAAWLAHAIQSAQKQTHPLIEIVVVDDCSTDSTQRLLDYIAPRDRRIKVIRNEKNLGRSASRNIGNAAATGDVILVLDADDLAYPNRAELSIKKLAKADFIHGSCDVIDCVGNRASIHIADVFDREKALESKFNYMIHSTCAYTKAVAEKYKYRDGAISDLGIDDWAFQLEVGLNERVDFTPAVIGAYRETSTGISVTRDPEKVKKEKEAFLALHRAGIGNLAGASL